MDANPGSSTKRARLDEHQSESSQLPSGNPNQSSSVPEEAEETGWEYAITSNSDISGVIGCLTPDELQELYINLGLDTPSIKNAEDSTGTFDVTRRARSVFELWRQRHGQNTTRKLLLEALERCKYITAKESLQDKWKVKGPHALPPMSFMQPHASSSAQGTHLLPQQQMTRPSFPGATYSSTLDTHYTSVPQTPAHQQYPPFDVASCQDELKAIYRRKRGGIGFLPGIPKEFNYLLDKFFVELELIKHQNTRVQNTELEKYIDLLNIKDTNGQRINHILVSGLAGTGKTTLISRLAYEWAKVDETETNTQSTSSQQSEFPLRRFEFVFVLDIRAFKPDLDLVSTVIDQLLKDYGPCKDVLKAFLLAKAAKCLYLFDGYDELYSSTEKVLGSSLLNRSCVIVTSRPNTVDRFNSTNEGYVQVLLKGFSESSVIQFVYKYFWLVDVAEEAEKMLKKIASTQFLQTIAHFPLLLAMMCLIWTDNQDLPKTISSLYKEVIEYLTRQWKARDDSFKDDSFKDFKEKANNLLLLLGKTALDGLMHEDSKLIFQEEEFGSSLVEQACNLGVMSRESKRIKFDKVTFVSFIHKTFQEFCAAVYLASLAKSDQDLLRSYLTRMNEDDMEYVLKFSCGESGDAAEIILQHIVVKSHQCQIKDVTNVDSYRLHTSAYQFWKLPLILLYEAESQADVRHQTLHKTLEPLTDAPFTLSEGSIDSEYRAVLASFVSTNQSQASQPGWLKYVDKAVIYFKDTYDADAADDDKKASTIMMKLLSQMSMLSGLAIRDGNFKDSTRSKINKCLQIVIEHNVFSKGLKKLVICHLHSSSFSPLNEYLVHQKHLELLKFENWREELEFASLFFPESVQELHLLLTVGYSNINLEGVESLNHTNLINFGIKYATYSNFQEQSKKSLSMLRMPKLKQLRLDGYLDEQSAKALAVSLQYSPELRTLALKGGYEAYMGPHGAVAVIASLCHMPHLTVLDLQYNGIGDKGAIELSKSLHYIPCLENVNVARNEIGPEGIIALSNSFEHIKQVKVMNINVNHFEDEGIEAVVNSLPHIQQLKHLDLNCIGISHAGCRALFSSLQYIPELSHLDLELNNIGDDGITALSQSLHCIPNVTYLILHNTHIGNVGVIALCRSIHHISQLQYLDLGGNKIGDDGLIALAASFHEVRHLTDLKIDTRSSYGPAGLEAVFKNLVHLPELDQLDVTCEAQTPITEYSDLYSACIKELGWIANPYINILPQWNIKQIVNVVNKFKSQIMH